MADLSQQLSAWSKAVASMDMTTSSEQMLNMIAALKVPGVNMDALVASQRDNLEALNAANQAALEGMKAVGEWQAKLLQETMRELTAAIGKLSQSGSPQQLLAAESDLAKKAFATAVGQMQELTQIVIQANQQASAAIAKRIPESLGEIKDVLKLPEASGKA
ncbi:MAG: TIGR01841 family phasin [Candidatus Accumulibacter sp.]|mgnify:FL=1|uniref:phasin family protein n=1 Tax=unclassified Candidatus Accumulibacter TaxID=2619054 RepID=UPI001A4555C9|nr:MULTISPECIES: TIGR01841 family phasin [unclassified Candidatus Accumulibacter]MBL8368371.1 TIGR01841 family phasin [Accumulibacter sp.]MBN8514765.1 TIGR01841 family phasin [Accumulibacter sp.]MBO3702558.1 TIGR01841 family phasin [Accumulibacter sp.]HRI91143.1 TIGR01841 family phasin [Accumulibacter sp.]